VRRWSDHGHQVSNFTATEFPPVDGPFVAKGFGRGTVASGGSVATWTFTTGEILTDVVVQLLDATTVACSAAEPIQYRDIEQFTGGTGRFVHGTGYIVTDACFGVVGPDVDGNGTFTITYQTHGTICLPAAAERDDRGKPLPRICSRLPSTGSGGDR
jgi:hypothetical protein